jgi:hypothetical protein
LTLLHMPFLEASLIRENSSICLKNALFTLAKRLHQQVANAIKNLRSILLMAVRWLALLLLTAIPTFAQTGILKNTSLKTLDEISSGEMSGAEGGAAVTSLPRESSRQPVSHRVVDKKFIFVMGALGGAESLRFASRKLVLDNEYAAGAPWVTHVPANNYLVAKYAGLYAAELLTAYEIKKPHSWLPGDRVIRRFWWAYPAAMTALHVKNGIGNMQTQGPGGCTSIACAMQIQ